MYNKYSQNTTKGNPMTEISFCVATSRDHSLVQRVIDNIKSLNIPTYEIVYCGGETTTIPQSDNVRHIPFDETIKVRWITRKKNLAVQNARYDVCIIFHDYILFDANWYKAFEEFGTHWDICHHQTVSIDGERMDGWRIHEYPGLPLNCMVPYDVVGLEQFMALQGNYHCIKRWRYLEDQYDEEFSGWVAEEMHWATRIVPNSYVRCNPNCIVVYGLKMPEKDIISCRNAYQEMLNYEHVFQKLRNCRIQNWKPRDASEAVRRNDIRGR